MITVIVPHLNQPEKLELCLKSLASGSLIADEIIVVDNGSESMPRSVCDNYPNVELMQELEPGPGPARNRGISVAKGEILAFIDADCVADPAWLQSARMRIAQGAEILGGDVRILHRVSGQPDIWEAYESEFAYRMEHYIRQQGFTGTGNLVVRATVMAEVGPFAGIGMAEDRDWGQRATSLGHKIDWVPEMVVYHPAREDFSELARKWDRHVAHDFVLFAARPMGRLKWATRSLLMIASPFASIPRIMRSKRIEGGGFSKLKAFMGLIRVRLYRARRMLGVLLFADKTGGGLENRWREKP